MTNPVFYPKIHRRLSMYENIQKMFVELWTYPAHNLVNMIFVRAANDRLTRGRRHRNRQSLRDYRAVCGPKSLCSLSSSS